MEIVCIFNQLFYYLFIIWYINFSIVVKKTRFDLVFRDSCFTKMQNIIDHYMH